MKKRLRKKYRVGEFQQLCFHFSFEYKGDVNSSACEDFLNALVSDCIEANGLNCDGHLGDEGCIITVAAVDPTKTNQAQLDTVKAWLESRDDIELKGFTDLEDLNYSGF